MKQNWLKEIELPALMLGANVLMYVSNHKYIGMFIDDLSCDKADMNRQKRGIYCRGNVLVKRFRNCNPQVKTQLFKAYMSSFYCLNLWNKFTLSQYSKVKSSYNRVFRNFFNVDTMNMRKCMVDNKIKTFGETSKVAT